jgi:hypothetical protein
MLTLYSLVQSHWGCDMKSVMTLLAGLPFLAWGVWPGQSSSALLSGVLAQVRGGDCQHKNCSQWTCFMQVNVIKEYDPYWAMDTYWHHNDASGGHPMQETKYKCRYRTCSEASRDCAGTEFQPDSTCTSPTYCTSWIYNEPRWCCAEGGGPDEHCIKTPPEEELPKKSEPSS